MSQTAPRPSAVSSACLFIGLSSALLLVQIMGWLTSWNSLEQQEIIGELGKSLQLSDTTTLASSLRIALMAMVVLLVTGGVGAVYAARGHQVSRVMISVVGIVVAMLFVFSGSLIGLIPAAFAIGSVIRLWSGDATRWFAARNATAEPAQSATSPANQFVLGPAPAQPVPTHLPTARRPGSVDTASLITAIASFTAIGCAAFYLMIYALVPEQQLIDAQKNSPVYSAMEVSDAELSQALTTMVGLAVVTVVLSLAALVAAFALSRRKRWASGALLALSVVTIALGAITIVGLIWGGLAVWVIVLLRRDATRLWLR